jgi:hypothetical protein
MEQALVKGQADAALASLEKLNEGPLVSGKNKVLYYLDKGMLLRMQGKYADSNEAFETAKALIYEFDALSLSEQAGTFFINDATRMYVGEHFEQVLIHLFSALNYLELGDLDAARVEALQVDQRLRLLTSNNNNAVYKEDAFVRYLTGVIYEALGEWSNAMIAYRKAYESYQVYREQFNVAVPETLKRALLRISEQQGLTNERRQYQSEFDIEDWQSMQARAALGEVVVVLNSGLAPKKWEKSLNAIAPRSGQLVRIAVPAYRVRPNNVERIQVSITNKQTNEQVKTQGELMENIDAIALKTLDAQMPAIVARATARAVAKYQMNKAAARENDAAGLILNIFNALTERADTRSWLTLPKNIFLARMTLEPGTYDVQVDWISSRGTIVESTTYPDIAVKQQKTNFITDHRVS